MQSQPSAVHVWFDAAAAADRGVAEYYSVSAVDETGDEIYCDRGSRSLAKAWAMGCAMADDHGIECVEMRDESGRITDRYTPEIGGKNECF